MSLSRRDGWRAFWRGFRSFYYWPTSLLNPRSPFWKNTESRDAEILKELLERDEELRKMMKRCPVEVTAMGYRRVFGTPHDLDEAIAELKLRVPASTAEEPSG